MAHVSNLPCDGDGICMLCKAKPPPEDTLTCKTCVTPWHVSCLSVKPPTMAAAANWDCPDCCLVADAKPVAVPNSQSADLIAAIRAIEADASLTDQEKAKRRQDLLSGVAQSPAVPDAGSERRSDVLDLLDKQLYCSICMQLPDRPVTTPCGHNFCLKCFQKWVGQGKQNCANCRHLMPSKMVREPRINSALVTAIRTAKLLNTNASGGPAKIVQFIHNQNRPDKAFTTERAKKSGKANACSGKIFVTIPHDHFGPIPLENDPERKQGVLVGETWEDRMECRQWGAHFPHVAGIAGQSDYGAQSVALSGGYEDDEDHGEWFLYTGSGGRDLSGNKRTNKKQSFDQKFDKLNEALRVSCHKGYPVRVVRSHKEKRSSYAPMKGVRYDGIYRIEKCWRKAGQQGFLVCRYLFVRCDNDPAPWTSDTHGDRPRPLLVIKELKDAKDVTERKGAPAWDYDEEKGSWLWKRPPPESRIQVDGELNDDGNTTRRVRRQKKLSVKERLLKEFSCLICRKVMVLPLTTPCAHNFCKECLEGAFAGQSFIRQRTCEGRRTLRAQKNIMKCPSCKHDISDFLQNPQVNRELMNVIESLQRETEEDNIECGIETETESAESGSELRDEADKNGNLDILAGDKENCDINSGSLEEAEDKKGDLAIETETESAVSGPELRDEADKNDMLAGDKENCDINSGSLEEAKDKKGDLAKPLTSSKSQKRKRASNSSRASDAGVKTRTKRAKDNCS